MSFNKINLKFLLILSLLLVASSYASCQKKAAKFLFQNKFSVLKINNDIRIIRIKKNDDFFYNLSYCKPNFYKGKIAVQEYYLESQNKFNKIGIVEYVFIDSTSANNAYHIAVNYAEFTRNLTANHFYERCDDSPLTQVYYASKDGLHVFLYTMYYNFIFTKNQPSVDAIISYNRRFLLSECYRQMTDKL